MALLLVAAGAAAAIGFRWWHLHQRVSGR